MKSAKDFLEEAHAVVPKISTEDGIAKHKAGGSVFVAFGPSSVLARSAVLTGHAVDQPVTASRGSARFQVAGEGDDLHPVAMAAAGLRPAKFFLHARIRPAEGDDIPIRLGNGDPLLIEHRLGDGRVLLFASSFDNVWNDLPLTPVFVPFVTEAARHLAGAESERGEMLLGSVLELGRRRRAGSTVQVIDPSGERVLSLSDSVNREVVTVGELGFYEIRGGSEAALVGVNPDPRESDLRRIEASILDVWQSTGRAAEGGAPSPSQVPPWRLWRIVLAALVAVVLVESLVGNRHLDAVRGV